MDQGKKKLTSVLWLGGLTALVLVFFSPALGQTFYFRDSFNMFYPFRSVVADSWRQGTVTLWDSWETMGSPFVGELGPGWFYPGNVIYLFLSDGVSFRIFLAGHFVLAAAFMWLWLAELKLHPGAAAAGAISYTLSGYALTQSGLMDMLVTVAWVPGSLWLLSLHLTRRKVTFLLLFGVSLTMPFLSGRAEGTMIIAAIAGGWLACSELSGPDLKARGITILKVMPAAGAVALAATMIQFWPTLELGRLSMKGEGYDLTETTLWSFHPFRLLEFFLPSPWGRFWPRDNYCAWDLTGWAGYYPFALTEYMGLPIIAGTIIAAARGSRTRRITAAILLLFALFLSLGSHTPFFRLMAAVFPPLRIFRFPEKYLIAAVLLLAAAGATGLDRFLAWLGQRPSNRTLKLIAIGAAAALILSVLAARFPFATAGSCINAAGQERHRLPENYLGLQITHVLIVLAGLALLIALARFRPLSRLAGPGLMLLCFADLGLANAWVIPYVNTNIYEGEPAVLAQIRAHAAQADPTMFAPDGKARLGAFRLMREPHMPREEVLFGMEGKTRFERYRRWERNTLLENFNYLYRVEALTGYSAAATADFNRLMREHLNSRTMALFNVRYAVTPAGDTALARQGVPLAFEDYLYAVKVYYFPHAFPRAYLVGRSLRVPKVMERLDLLASHDFSRAAVIEDDPDLPPESEESDLAVTAAEVISYEPDEVRLRTRTESAAWLILSDLYFPGWKAEIDGAETKIFRANFLVRAVWVPAGEREVVFRYEPASYYRGRAVSIAALILMVLVIVIEMIVLPAKIHHGIIVSQRRKERKEENNH